jgi:hypothetical protein
MRKSFSMAFGKTGIDVLKRSLNDLQPVSVASKTVPQDWLTTGSKSESREKNSRLSTSDTLVVDESGENAVFGTCSIVNAKENPQSPSEP